jgi:hypothetical protein
MKSRGNSHLSYWAVVACLLSAGEAAFAASPAPDAAQPDPSPVTFDAGADLRVRQEIMRNVPGLPGGGVLYPRARRDWLNHMRFRPRLWGQVTAGGSWRLLARLTDEMRWNVSPDSTAYTFPDEVLLDNLYLEGVGLFDGFVDLRLGRQDLYNLYGLDHLFVDGTPGDGSRTLFADMVRVGFTWDEARRLDLFFLHCSDETALRWGTERSRHRSLAGLGGGAQPDRDDWGWGAVWSGTAAGLPYQIFALQKVSESYRRGSIDHPWTRRELLGVKTTPQLTDAWSLQLEAMGQIGRDGDGAWLSGWSTYCALNWRQAEAARATPFASLGFHTMSGDRDAADEEGGHRAWDPMWSRGVNDSELFLYGTHYGVGWWSNQLYLKLAGGIDFAARRKLTASCGPMFATVADGLGGGDGHLKGFLSQARYDFPLIRPETGGRFEIFGHLVAEFFNPGGYFETGKPAWFVRWEVDFVF